MADHGLAEVKNAADPEQVQRAERRGKTKEARRRDLVAWQMSTYQGRQFVCQEIERHGVFDLEPAAGTKEAVFTFLGRRYAGLMLLNELRAEHPEAYRLMEQEADHRRTRDQAELNAGRRRKEDVET